MQRLQFRVANYCNNNNNNKNTVLFKQIQFIALRTFAFIYFRWLHSLLYCLSSGSSWIYTLFSLSIVGTKDQTFISCFFFIIIISISDYVNTSALLVTSNVSPTYTLWNWNLCCGCFSSAVVPTDLIRHESSPRFPLGFFFVFSLSVIYIYDLNYLVLAWNSRFWPSKDVYNLRLTTRSWKVGVLFLGIYVIYVSSHNPFCARSIPNFAFVQKKTFLYIFRRVAWYFFISF